MPFVKQLDRTMPCTKEPSKGRHKTRTVLEYSKRISQPQDRGALAFLQTREQCKGAQLGCTQWSSRLTPGTSQTLASSSTKKPSWNPISQLLTDVYEPLDTGTQLAGTSRAPSITTNLTHAFFLPKIFLRDSCSFSKHVSSPGWFSWEPDEGCCLQPCASILHLIRAGRFQTRQHTALIVLSYMFVPTCTDSHWYSRFLQITSEEFAVIYLYTRTYE